MAGQGAGVQAVQAGVLGIEAEASLGSLQGRLPLPALQAQLAQQVVVVGVVGVESQGFVNSCQGLLCAVLAVRNQRQHVEGEGVLRGQVNGQLGFGLGFGQLLLLQEAHGQQGVGRAVVRLVRELAA